MALEILQLGIVKKFLPCPFREREEERTPFRALPLRLKSCCEMQTKAARIHCLFLIGA